MRPKKVHELLTDDSCWTQRMFARTWGGRAVEPCDPEAYAWCLSGAVHRCYPASEQPAVREKLKAALALTGQGDEALEIWNDHRRRTFQEVRDLVVKLDL